jgi:hypothetical protein
LDLRAVPVLNHLCIRIRLANADVRSDRYPSGAWLKHASVLISDSALKVENVFECDVSVPHTDITIRKTTLYSPGE